MTDQGASRRRAVLLVVLSVIAVGLGAMLLIGVIQDDETDHIDPQNGQVIWSVASYSNW